MPVLHRLPRPAGGDAQRTVSAAAVCHGEPAAALPLRPQPRHHGRSAASGPAQVGAHTGGHVHFGKVSFVTVLTSVGLRLVKHLSSKGKADSFKQIMERSKFQVPKPVLKKVKP